MAASFFEGAVGGFFKGRDWREGVDERRRLRKMDDQRFEWEKEDRDYTLDVRGDEKKERKRRISRQEEEDQFWRDLAEGSEPAAETPKAAATPPAAQPPVPDATVTAVPPTATPATTPPTASAPATTPVPPRREIRADPTVALPPDERPPAAPPPQMAGPEPAMPTQAGGVVAPQRVIAKIPDTAPNEEFRPAPTGQEPSYEEWQAMSREDRAKAGLPVSEIGGQWHYRNRDGAWGGPDLPQGPTVPQRAPAAPDAPAYSEPPVALPGSASAREQAPPPPAPLSMLDALADDTRLDPNTRMAAGQRAEGARRQRDIAAAANGRAYTSLQPAAPTAPAPDSLPQTSEGTPMASVATVEKAAAQAPAPDSAKAAAAAADQSVKTFKEDYLTTQAEKIVKFYTSRGEIEKAKTYSDWIKDEAVQKGMEHWARAVHAATIGDSGKFVSEIARAYNSSGYFDDGYSVVEEASGIHKDPKTGAVTGGQITFKSEKTGETFTQTFDDSRDLYELGVNFLSPEQVFEFGWKQIASQEEYARKLAEKGLSDDAAKRVTETIKALSDANTEFGLMPLDQQIAEALAYLNRFAGNGGMGDVPVAGRP